MAPKIQFKEGIDEETIPNIMLTRSRDGSTGTATFRFENPNILTKENSKSNSITGMFLIDDEGILITRNIKANFLSGKPVAIEALYIMKTRDSWDRFMRFINAYSKANALTFIKSDVN